MSLKISFESDIKGFERVQRALESQEKILNQNADAVERLQKAQSGLTDQALNIKGMESIKGTEKQIKDLTQSLDTLSSKRGGLTGFLNIFSDFGGELKKLNAEASVGIFKTMTGQVDTLKASMSGTSQLIKNLRNEINEATAAGKGKEAAQKTQQLDQLTTKQMAEGELLRDLQKNVILNAPLLARAGQPPGGDGTMAGFLGGGTSLNRLGALMTRMMGVMAGVGTAATVGTKFLEGEERGAEATFNREMALARGAMSGDVGRLYMQRRGIGEEAALVEDGLVTNRDGSVDATTMFRSLRLATKRLDPRNIGVSNEELLVEEQNRRANLDQRKRFAINEATKQEMALAADPRIMNLEMQYGYGGSRGLLNTFLSRGIAIDQATPAMERLARQGLRLSGDGRSSQAELNLRTQRTRLEAMEEELRELRPRTSGREGRNRQNRATKLEGQIEEQRAALEEAQKQRDELRQSTGLGGIADLIGSRNEALLVTDRVKEQLARQAVLDQQQGRGLSAGRLRADLAQTRGNLGANARTPAAVATAMADYAAQLQGQTVGYRTTMESVTQTAGMAAQAIGNDPSLTAMERFQTAMSTQGRLQEDIGRGGGAMNMATDMALINLGITDFGDRANINKLLQENPDRAAALAASLLGAEDPNNPDDPTVQRVKRALNLAVADTTKLQDKILGSNPESRAAYESVGLDKATFVLSGDSKVSTAAAGRARRDQGLFNLSGERAQAFTPRGTPTQEDFDRAKATYQQDLIKSQQDIMNAVGSDLRNEIVKAVSEGFIKMGENIGQSARDLETSRNAAPLTEKPVTPVTGTRGR